MSAPSSLDHSYVYDACDLYYVSRSGGNGDTGIELKEEERRGKDWWCIRKDGLKATGEVGD